MENYTLKLYDKKMNLISQIPYEKTEEAEKGARKELKRNPNVCYASVYLGYTFLVRYERRDKSTLHSDSPKKRIGWK